MNTSLLKKALPQPRQIIRFQKRFSGSEYKLGEIPPENTWHTKIKPILLFSFLAGWFVVNYNLFMKDEERHHRRVAFREADPYKTDPRYLHVLTNPFPWECSKCPLFDRECHKKCKAELHGEEN